tara:strand:- start:1263 stop:2477 length:1215 start_codon:yes stop_codon:yes gene_type:complete
MSVALSKRKSNSRKDTSPPSLKNQHPSVKSDEQLQKDQFLLSNLMNSRSLSIKEIGNAIGRSPTSLYEVFNEKRIFSQIERIALHSVFNLPKDDLGMDKEDTNVWEIYGGPKRKNSLVTYVPSNSDNYDYQDFLEDMFNSLTSYIQGARKSIKILDYCAKNFQHYRQIRNSEVSKSYTLFHELYRNFLSSISRAVENNNELRYEMFYQLPLHELKNQKEGSYFSFFAECASNYLYNNDFVHIKWAESEKVKDRVKIGFFEKPVRNYTVIIIDDRTVLSLCNRVNFYGESYPDVLFVSEKEDHGNMGQLIRCYLDTLSDHGDRSTKVGIDVLEELLNDLMKSKSKERISMNDQILSITKDKNWTLKDRERIENDLDNLKSEISIIEKKSQILSWSIEDTRAHLGL